MEENTVYTHMFNGLQVKTGDILCTRDGEEGSLFGQLWRWLGRLVPGEIDHCLMYVGPGGRCVESAAKGTIVFEMPGQEWEAGPLFTQRWLLDTFYGVVYPLAERGLSAAEEERIRLGAANYCLEQAAQNKPYNLNFFDPQHDGAFYCSQLIYKAYLAQGIALDTGQGTPGGMLKPIVFPQEIWDGCVHRLAENVPARD